MIKEYIQKDYINNYSEINSFSNDKEFKQIINKLDRNIKIKVTSNLIHKENDINQLEQFIFNLDNYITYIKQFIHINQLELKYLLNQTIYNEHNKILYSNLYYYDNVDLYIKEFQKMFMYKYLKNTKLLNIEQKTFDSLVNHINTHKKRTYCYFENIKDDNISFYKTIINDLESSN